LKLFAGNPGPLRGRISRSPGVEGPRMFPFHIGEPRDNACRWRHAAHWSRKACPRSVMAFATLELAAANRAKCLTNLVPAARFHWAGET